jgi:ABC-type transporter Mla maintaining outer membrane lipid asymmetry ATPase subunit MlaF
VTTLVLELLGVTKDYGGLRPLRIERLAIGSGEQAALVGIDRPAAEILINIITGAVLPDRGEMRAFGRATSDIQSGEEWLVAADRFGMVSERAVLLDAFTVVQNLAVPFSLEIEPPAADVREQALALAGEVGLDPLATELPVGEIDAVSRARVRLARALALEPAVLLLEHPTAGLPRADVRALARQVRTVAERRGIATLTLTADREFADHVALRVLTLDAATGRVSEPRRGWPFGRRA